MKADLHLAFDVGHSSIGWAVLHKLPDAPSSTSTVLGTGAVTFGADDCLAVKRRKNRQARRHARPDTRPIRPTDSLAQRERAGVREKTCEVSRGTNAPGCSGFSPSPQSSPAGRGGLARRRSDSWMMGNLWGGLFREDQGLVFAGDGHAQGVAFGYEPGGRAQGLKIFRLQGV